MCKLVQALRLRVIEVTSQVRTPKPARHFVKKRKYCTYLSQLNQFKLLINSDCYIYLYLILIDKDCHMDSGLFLVGERNMSQLFAKECFLKMKPRLKKKNILVAFQSNLLEGQDATLRGVTEYPSKPLNKKK